MNTQESTATKTWPKVAIPATLVAAIAAGAMFSPIGVASADTVADEETTEEAASTEGSSSERSEEKAAKKAERKEAIAGILGITVEELEAGREDGQTLAELAEANGVDRDTLVSSMVELAEARIDEAVADGKIDEEKAAELREGLAEKVESKIDRVKGEGRGDSDRGNRGEGRSRSDRSTNDDSNTEDDADAEEPDAGES